MKLSYFYLFPPERKEEFKMIQQTSKRKRNTFKKKKKKKIRKQHTDMQGKQTELNPYLTNGFSHHYHLDEYTFIFRGVRSDFLFSFSMKFL